MPHDIANLVSLGDSRRFFCVEIFDDVKIKRFSSDYETLVGAREEDFAEGQRY